MVFQNFGILENWLNEQGISTTCWGQGQSKTAVDLWQEIQSGDTVLSAGPVRRLVQVVEIKVQQGPWQLRETAQELADGRCRQRHLPPSEKIKPGEALFRAAQRCLWEEIGLPPENIRFLSATSRPHEHERPSLSYPGLITRYTVFQVHTAVTGLPHTDFWHDNIAHAHGDPVKRHHWTWVAAPATVIK